MYSVMIVDDEPLMVKYLKNNIGRIAPAWQVSGIAMDGLQAIELLQRQNFDLVITDIRMPEMDGLELAKYISEIHPQTKVVIISGFDDFDYARRAIRCGVSDYLLKPLSDENISETLKKIAEQIRRIQTESFSENILAKAEELPDDKIRSLFFDSIINRNSDNMKSVYSVMAGRQMELLHQPCTCVMVLGVDCAELLAEGKGYREIVSCQMRLNQLCEKSGRNAPNSAVCYCGDDNTAILICGRNRNSVVETAETVYEQIRSRMENDYSIKVKGAYGPAQEDILCLQNSYQSAAQAFLLTFFERTPLESPENLLENQKFLNSVELLSSAVCSDYISNHDSRIFSDLMSYFENLKGWNDTLTPVRFGLHLLNRIARQCEIRKNRLERAFQQLELLWKDSCGMPGQKEIAETFYRAVLALDKDEVSQSPEDNNQLADRAKEYISDHYSEPISLTLVAEKLGVSSSYLSDLFHREVGEPYSKFVTRVRMEQAITLMKANPNKKIYTLAAEVGFINAKHFNSVFKKFYHVTPTEYFKTVL